MVQRAATHRAAAATSRSPLEGAFRLRHPPTGGGGGETAKGVSKTTGQPNRRATSAPISSTTPQQRGSGSPEAKRRGDRKSSSPTTRTQVEARPGTGRSVDPSSERKRGAKPCIEDARWGWVVGLREAPEDKGIWTYSIVGPTKCVVKHFEGVWRLEASPTSHAIGVGFPSFRFRFGCPVVRDGRRSPRRP